MGPHLPEQPINREVVESPRMLLPYPFSQSQLSLIYDTINTKVYQRCLLYVR